MNAQLQKVEGTDQYLLLITEIREKVKLLNKCRRKMEMAVIDADSLQILVAAHEQLTAEINYLCHEAGL